MQQLSRTCKVKEHYSKPIEYICVYPQCEMSRFLCSKCALGTSHKHNQSDNSHIMDSRDFYENIMKNINQAKSKQQQVNYNIQKYIDSLKQLIKDVQNLLENVQKTIQKVENCRQENYNINYQEDQLINVQKYGFNEIDEQSVNNLINIQFDISKQFENQANLILQNTIKIQEWHLQLVKIKQLSQLYKIKDAMCQIQQIDDTGDKEIKTGAISNDLKYIVSGGSDNLLKIWDYQSNKLIKQINLNSWVCSCQFTEDSTLLNAGSNSYIYQFDVQNQFKVQYKQKIHDSLIYCINCITNTIILTSSYDGTIIKTYVDQKQQLLKIQAHTDSIQGLDYNKSLNIIASGSNDKSIKLWDGNDGSLIIEKLNAHNNNQFIKQVLFIINNNQLISLCSNSILIIWNINYETRKLEQLQLIKDSVENISLVLQQLYIIAIGKKSIKVYSIKGEFIRQFDHKVENFWYFNTVQLDSMKAIFIKGKYKLQVCQIDMD